MGRSQRANRGPARYLEDRLGDRHYPGRGAAAKGEVINPALKPGDRIGYIYDWSATWPSGSTGGQPPVPNDSATYGGLTLTNTGLPDNAGVLTATGSVDENLRIIILMAQDSAAGDFNIGGQITVSQGTSLADTAIAIANMLQGLDNMLASATGDVVNYNLQSAGVIDAMRVYIGAQASGGATVPPPAPSPIPSPLPPGGVDGPTSSGHGVNFWLSRSGGQGSIWYYWIDVDNTPGPDTKRNLTEFLADDLIGQNYRDDVRARAELLGWSA